MEAINSQRLSGMLARSFSSFRSDQAEQGQRMQRGHGVHRPGGDHGNGHKPKAAAQEADASANLSYRRSEGTSLFIKTQEGDLVKLKISSRESLSMAATLKQDGDQSVADVTKQSASSLRVSFEVDGDLNEEELAAIGGVIEQASALAQKFFNDDVDGAFAAAASLQIDGSQLANVGLRMSLRESLTYTGKGLPQAASLVPPPAATTPEGPTGATATPAATEPPPAALPTAVTETPALETPPAEDAMGTPVAATPEPLTTTPGASLSAPDVIRNFLTQLMDRLSAPPAVDGKGSSATLEMSLKLRIFQSVVMSAAETRAAEAGTDATLSPLVPETLDALAARQEAPLEAVA